MKVIREMELSVRLRGIVSGPYQDEDILDFMNVIDQKYEYQHYDLIIGFKSMDYIKVMVISKMATLSKK